MLWKGRAKQLLFQMPHMGRTYKTGGRKGQTGRIATKITRMAQLPLPRYALKLQEYAEAKMVATHKDSRMHGIRLIRGAPNSTKKLTQIYLPTLILDDWTCCWSYHCWRSCTHWIRQTSSIVASISFPALGRDL